MVDHVVQRKAGPVRSLARMAMRLSASLLPRHATVRQTRLDGMPLLVWANEYIGRRILTTGSFEKEDLARLADFVKPGDTCIDVGANIGLYSLALARLTGAQGRVHAFEPVRRNALLVELNCALNDIDTVTVDRRPLSNEGGRALSARVPENDSAYSYFAEGGSAEADGTATSVTLDDYCLENRIGKISFIKIDIEGAEFNALRGAGELLASGNRPDVIMVEMVDAYLERFGTDTITVCAWMGQKGYFPYALRHGVLQPVEARAINVENVFFKPKS